MWLQSRKLHFSKLALYQRVKFCFLWKCLPTCDSPFLRLSEKYSEVAALTESKFLLYREHRWIIESMEGHWEHLALHRFWNICLKCFWDTVNVKKDKQLRVSWNSLTSLVMEMVYLRECLYKSMLFRWQSGITTRRFLMLFRFTLFCFELGDSGWIIFIITFQNFGHLC